MFTVGLQAGLRVNGRYPVTMAMALHGNAAVSPSQVVITRPDDWHLHVRDGAGLSSVVPFTAQVFGRAIIMPNLVPPVVATEQVNIPCYLLQNERKLL